MKRVEVRRTPNGFIAGPMEVVLAASDPDLGTWLHIHTGRQIVEIRSTPKGFLRIGEVKKDWKGPIEP